MKESHARMPLVCSEPADTDEVPTLYALHRTVHCHEIKGSCRAWSCWCCARCARTHTPRREARLDGMGDARRPKPAPHTKKACSAAAASAVELDCVPKGRSVKERAHCTPSAWHFAVPSRKLISADRGFLNILTSSGQSPSKAVTCGAF